MQICAGDESALLLRAGYWIYILTHLLIQQDVFPTAFLRAVLYVLMDNWWLMLLVSVCLGSDLEVHNNLLLICHCSHEFKHLEITGISYSKCNYGGRNQLVLKLQAVIVLKLFM